MFREGRGHTACGRGWDVCVGFFSGLKCSLSVFSNDIEPHDDFHVTVLSQSRLLKRIPVVRQTVLKI